jgi:hypothetical protein
MHQLKLPIRPPGSRLTLADVENDPALMNERMGWNDPRIGPFVWLCKTVGGNTMRWNAHSDDDDHPFRRMATSSVANLVTVFVTVRVCPFFLTVTLMGSCTFMVSTLRVRSYINQRYWVMQPSAMAHSSEASSDLASTSGSAGAIFIIGSALADFPSELVSLAFIRPS